MGPFPQIVFTWVIYQGGSVNKKGTLNYDELFVIAFSVLRDGYETFGRTTSIISKDKQRRLYMTNT